MVAIKDKNGRVPVGEDETKKRWKECFEKLLNVENEREARLCKQSRRTNRRGYIRGSEESPTRHEEREN